MPNLREDVTFFEFTPFYSPQSSVAIPPTSVLLPVHKLSVTPHTEPPTRPLQVYPRRNRSTNTTLTSPPDLPPTAAPGNPSETPANDLPIVLQKGKGHVLLIPWLTLFPFKILVLTIELSLYHFHLFLSLILLVRHYDIRHGRFPWTTKCLLSFRGGHGSLWGYLLMPILLLVDGSLPSNFVQMGHLNDIKLIWLQRASLRHMVDYFETFSPVARLNSIRVLFSLAINLNWPMYQMDIKNAFLYGELNETVYMEQPPSYVAQGEKQRMSYYGEFGFSRCQADHSVFVQNTKSSIVVFAVYVDDILITGSDIVGIEEAKTYLQKS
ncbi:UNVERIFIED_CONTAM: Retrovirus-related Pol polyprotein from transposon RE1 [Sesamum calycinum]|uniref:Retrovirus-related Pol polyprotein from transposon RE1 n=1 Tax=Sesamum calycinum TaxID=2727403 RepID=A0AAW2N0M3_9LAMI